MHYSANELRRILLLGNPVNKMGSGSFALRGGGWVVEISGRAARCADPSKNPRLLSQLQAYIAYRVSSDVLRPSP